MLLKFRVLPMCDAPVSFIKIILVADIIWICWHVFYMSAAKESLLSARYAEV